jgi:hypothetical protein
MDVQYRDDLEKEMHHDFSALMNHLVPIAKELLEQQGEIYPIGGVINVIGKYESIGARLESEQPTAQEVFKYLGAGLEAGMRDGHFRSIGICMNVTVLDEANSGLTDAFHISMKHKEGRMMQFFVPYTTNRATKKVTMGKAFSRPVVV